jgi:hypothetical protein
MIESETGLPIVPHEFADPKANCCGCLVVELRGELADLACNECSVLIKTVPAAEVPMVLSQMLLSQTENCQHHCPHCGTLNTFPASVQCWLTSAKSAAKAWR